MHEVGEDTHSVSCQGARPYHDDEYGHDDEDGGDDEGDDDDENIEEEDFYYVDSISVQGPDLYSLS